MSYPVYEEVRASGVEWLGDIPVGWKIRRLKFISIVQPSNVDKKSDDNETPVLLCNYSDVYNNEFIDHSIEFMKATATSGEIEKFSVSKGDVIVTKDSESPEDIAIPAYIAEDFQNVLCGYHLTQIKPINILGKYLFRLFQSSLFNAQFAGGANGVTRFGLPQYVISNAFISLPPLPEQQRIAAFLDVKTAAIDDVIALKEQQVALLQRKRMALISHVVTKGLDPHAPMRDSGVAWLGEVPEGWEVQRLKFVAVVQSGLTLGKEYRGQQTVLRPYLRVANVQDGFLDLEKITQIAIPASEVGRYELRTGDVLMTEGGDFDKLGRGYIWEGQIEDCLHQNHIFAVRPNQRKVLPHFLSYLMTSLHGKNYFTSTAQQTTNLATTNSTKLGDFPLVLPPFMVQQEIIAYLDRETVHIDALVALIQAQTEKLRTYRQALITAAVTGKIDVRDIVQTPPAQAQHAYPLRSTPVTYIDPTEPVADADWEAAS